MTAAPETKYAATPDGYIGYQAFGSGPRDLLFITNWVTNVDELAGLRRHRGPILTAANWSGEWPGFVGIVHGLSADDGRS